MADNAQLSSPEDNDDAVAGDASEHEVPGDASDVEMAAAVQHVELNSAVSNVSARELKVFELEFELGGKTTKKQFNGELRCVNNCNFVDLSCKDLIWWIQSHVRNPDEPRPKTRYVMSKLKGLSAMRDAIDFESSRIMVGWGPADFPGKRPTSYLLKGMKSKGTLISIDNVPCAVNVCGQIIRVLPKLPGANCWVCTDDLPKVISVMQSMGWKLDEPLKGVSKRANKTNPSGYSYQIKVRGKFQSCATLEEAIEKLGQQ